MKDLSIKTKLICLLAFMSAMLATEGWLGLSGAQSGWAGMESIFTALAMLSAIIIGAITIRSGAPVTSRFLWALKYDLIFSQFDKTVTDGMERQPWFYAIKLSFKPYQNMEFGFNLGRQVGGARNR